MQNVVSNFGGLIYYWNVISKKAIYFLSLTSYSINKLKSHMLFTNKNFVFSDFIWKTLPNNREEVSDTSLPNSPCRCLQPWLISQKYESKYSRIDHVKFTVIAFKFELIALLTDHIRSNFFKATFHKICLARSWLLCLITKKEGRYFYVLIYTIIFHDIPMVLYIPFYSYIIKFD